ncbi:putative ABC transporter permease [Clostridium sp. E02]|uniref:putative ABC transporter permease n=1 Tax=Clostridium sp. E02 TaxID=2487134 RepID=UPI000F51EC3E|nr:putative ABC transporter permease [Clostridium sp. E02]
MSIYHQINCFFLFSFLGYLLECSVLSFENRRIVYNRGFGHGPFCIIYGFGATGAMILLKPLMNDPILLYFASMAMATFMELVTANMMIRLFGSFWWDYSRKPFNYKGIICLESSIAWGFLGIFYFRYLRGFVNQTAGMIPEGLDRLVAMSLVIFYAVDFIYTMRLQFKGECEEDTSLVGRLKVY